MAHDIRQDLIDDPGMKAVSSDMSLIFRRAVELTEKTREALEVKSRDHDKMRFSVVYVNKLSDGI